MTTPVEELLWDRCASVLANILGVKDRIGIPDADESAHLRSVIMREVNDLTELAVELVKASSGGTSVNEVYIELLREIHSAVVKPDGNEPYVPQMNLGSDR